MLGKAFARNRLFHAKAVNCTTKARFLPFGVSALGDRYLFGQIDILNCVQQLDAFVHWALEGFSA